MTTYTGGCHCGAVRYSVDMEIKSVVSCNCSLCSKRGWLLAFTTPEHFRLESGEDTLTTYRFNKHVVNHQFCKICGQQSFARGTDPSGAESIAINVRCLDGVDTDSFPVTKFDGKNS